MKQLISQVFVNPNLLFNMLILIFWVLWFPQWHNQFQFLNCHPKSSWPKNFANKSLLSFIAIIKILFITVIICSVKHKGWATAELAVTRLLPLWVGARGMEFDWKYMQMSFDANICLVRNSHYWSWNQNDSVWNCHLH